MRVAIAGARTSCPIAARPRSRQRPPARHAGTLFRLTQSCLNAVTSSCVPESGLLEPGAPETVTPGSVGARGFAQSSRELKGLQRELGDVHALRCVLVPGFAGTCRARLEFAAVPGGVTRSLTLSSREGHASRGHVLDARGALRYRVHGSGVRRLRFAGACGVVLLGGGFHELTGDGGIADGGGVVDPEHGGEVQRVGAAGEGFVELPVDPEPLEGGGQPAAGSGQPVLADGPGGHGGLLVDDQVRVGGARPPVAAVLEPGQEQVAGQVIERAGPAGDGQLPVAEVDVAGVQFPDGLGPGRVDSGQREREAGGGRDGRRGGCVDLGGLERLDEVQGPLARANASGGIAENPAGLLAVPEQRAQRQDGLPVQAAGQRLGGGGDVSGGDLAQVNVALSPLQQQRVDAVEVLPDGVLVAGTAAGSALAAGAQPVPDIGGHRCWQDGEPFGYEGGEGGDPVVVQEPGQAEDLGGAGDAQVPGVQGWWQRGPGDHFPGDVAGEDDGQCPAGLGDDPRVPAAGGGELGGDVPGLLQGLAGDCRCDPVGLVEVPGLTRNRQLQLCPGGRGGWPAASWGRRRGPRAGVAEPAHSRERQLLIAAGPGEVRRGDPAAGGGEAGLQPAQPAVALLHRDDPRAAGAFCRVVAAGEVVAGPAVRPGAVAGSEGQAVRAADGRAIGDRAAGHQAGGSERPSRRRGVTPGPACAGAAACWPGWPSPGRACLPGSAISSSSTPQPTTAQMTSRSSSLMLAGLPDHSPDIFPALITRPASASIRCSWPAIQASSIWVAWTWM